VGPALATAPATIAVAPIAAAIPHFVVSLTEQEFAADWLFDPSPPPHLRQANPILRI
jgi:hypothetical protein